MKALIISDKQEIIDFTSTFLKENNYDIIIYRWLLKALDNIEEIQPDVIILSAAEYPRHWKTLASFVKSGIGGNNVQLYLYEPEQLSNEEKRKAQELGIKAFINSLNEENLKQVIPSNNAELSFPSQKSDVKEKNNENSIPAQSSHTIKNKIIFTNPINGSFVFGNADYDSQNNYYICNLENIQDLNLNQIINYVSVYDSNSVISVFSAKIIKIENINTDKSSDSKHDKEYKTMQKLTIQPQEYYEKN